ncbi:MAG: hypothetical protein PHW62_00420 [Candidatus Ratteibacteria bacterium]|nr:hypothetical protein [Candidatus Ratteibacteria bacterium]
MITKDDISITYYHKYYQDLTPEEKIDIDNKYAAHQELRKKAEQLWGKEPNVRT